MYDQILSPLDKQILIDAINFAPMELSHDPIVTNEYYILEAIRSRIENQDITSTDQLVTYAPRLVSVLKARNDSLSRQLREAEEGAEKESIRPALRRCNALWRLLQDAFYELSSSPIP